MKIGFYGDSLTAGHTGVSYLNILQAKFPQHQALNYGRDGDTVRSLYQRIVTQRLIQPLDLAFVWIGVNDVFVHVAWSFPLFKILERKLWARTPEEFTRNYANILTVLKPHTGKIVTVSPVCVGEDFRNRWNQQLEQYGQSIRQCSQADETIIACDLRTRAAQELTSKSISPYIVKSVFRVALDALMYREPADVDRISAARGLHLTLDGVHLNSRGANLAAQAFGEIIHACEEAA